MAVDAVGLFDGVERKRRGWLEDSPRGEKRINGQSDLKQEKGKKRKASPTFSAAAAASLRLIPWASIWFWLGCSGVGC
jgi:hypothetical protein